MYATMVASRTKNTKRNLIFSHLYTFITLLFQFISRSLIVYALGSHYLGLSSLFTSILHVLSMSELGFSAAIIFNMYRPLAVGDTQAVCALLNFYRCIYRKVATVIGIAGIVISLFLPRLIHGSYPTDINIYVLYYLYLANTISSYIFFAYKAALLTALQRLDLTKIAYTAASIVQYTGQMSALLLFRSYYGFLVWLIIGTVAKNLFTDYLSKRYFSQYKPIGEISEDIQRDISFRVKGLLICNISAVTYTTFDSIILSSFIGLKSVAIYNNYVLILNGVMMFTGMLRASMQASVGNSIATETVEKNYDDMLIWQLIYSGIATWCSTCMFCLYQPFMKIWMGENMLLPIRDVILLCLWFFFSIVTNSFCLYLTGIGAWWEMRWPFIVSTILNLILNITLGKLIGITGIIFATLTSTLISGLFWQCNIIFKVYFKRSTAQFYRRLLVYFFVCVACCGISTLLADSIITTLTTILNSLNSLLTSKVMGITGITDIAGLFIRGIICTIVAVGIQLFLYSHLSFTKKEFKRAKSFIKRS